VTVEVRMDEVARHTGTLPHEFGNFVGGYWTTQDGEALSAVSPASGGVIASVPAATRQDVAAACRQAAGAAEAFGALTALERSSLCHRVADSLAKHEQELAHWLSLDQGKPLQREALVEARVCLLFFRQAAEDILRLGGDTIPSASASKRIFTSYRSRGPYAVITPWNFPYNIAAEHLSAHFAAGNPVVWVPSPEVAASGMVFARAVVEADLPPGVFNAVTGLGPVAGDAAVTDPSISGVSFTGSSATGNAIMHRAGAKPALLELGGNGPVIVLADADLSAAVEGIVFSAYFNAGQSCSATERVLVVREVREELVERLAAATATVVLGQPFAGSTTMGPLNNEAVATKMDAHIADAVDRGARLVSGGARAHDFPTNLYFNPTLLDGVSPGSLVAHEETFGPIIPLIEVDGPEKALQLANQDPTGLVASVYTRDLRSALTFARRLRHGLVNINETPDYWELSIPYGGGGGTTSGFGRLGGRHALRSVMDLQATIVELGS
jgi:acyl-CoA reductase-like NAD-dependent aldehyde dehydrogenase